MHYVNLVYLKHVSYVLIHTCQTILKRRLNLCNNTLVKRCYLFFIFHALLPSDFSGPPDTSVAVYIFIFPKREREREGEKERD